MASVFSDQILADKLAKLNSTQQSIETLSHWCIFHRSKAELVVTTWEKQFHSTEMTQKVPLLYLANDILQNSKRQGNEYVSDFWKVLPSALKDIISKGDERGKNVVSRLVNIWEERKVFGSRSKSLKDVMLGEEAPPPLELSKKRSRGVKTGKRDSKSSKSKLSVGGAAETIVLAYQVVLSEHSSEESETNKCKSVIKHIKKMEKDVERACSSAKDPSRNTLAKELDEEEKRLQKCIDKLKSVEVSRNALVMRLREALHEQESELEILQTQIQAAQAQVGEAQNTRRRLNDENYVSNHATAANPMPDSKTQPVHASTKSAAASIAALVAEKLTASSSSQMIMQSVLSTFAAEEAKNAGMAKTDASSSNNTYNQVMLPQATVQNQTSTTSQAQYHMMPNPPPSQQFMQTNPYGYGNIPLMPPGPPPGPPPPQHLAGGGLMGPATQPSQQMSTMTPANPAISAQQTPSFQPLKPPGMMFYGNPHHS